MNGFSWTRQRTGSGCVVAISIALVFTTSAGSAQMTVPSPAPPEALNLHGDPMAPDVAGVWLRADGGTASASKEGWLPWPPPLKPRFAATWQQRVAEAVAGKRTDDPVQACLPAGMPRFDTGMTGPMLIIQTPGRVMLYRDGMPVRRVWLDGRSFPAPKDLESFSNGNAMGRYEHGDLVIEVRGVRDQPIDATGVPHSDDLIIREQFHRVDRSTLRLTVTLTDPTAYSRPMTTTVTYKTDPEQRWEPKEWLCKPHTDTHPETFVH